MSIKKIKSGLVARVSAMVIATVSGSASALEFSLPGLGDETVEGVLNTTITAGGAWRMHDQSVDLIGKANLNPDLCGRNPATGRQYYQSCQGLFRTQKFTAERLVNAPGQFSMNADDGNINYSKGDAVSAVAKVTQDISLKMGDWGFFGKILFFYDAVNNNFEETHPNLITRDNFLQVGQVSSLLNDPAPRSDSRPCGARNPTVAGPCGIVYGKGGHVLSKRTDGETLREIGTDLQLLDAYFYGRLPLPFGEGKELTFKIGRQSVNWGESTLLAFGAINQANPINANNFYRVGSLVEEFFTPIAMVFLSLEPFAGATLESFYQLEWKPLETPAPGSYLSFVDLGTNDAGKDWVNLSFGGAADDRDRDPAFPNGGYGRLQDNALSGLTTTSLRAQRRPDAEPEPSGQFGIALKYYAEELNNGTELAFYFENYHSRIPMVSVFSSDLACSATSTSSAEFIRDCPDIPVFSQVTSPNNPAGATDTAIPFDSLELQLEYPKNIQLYGFSFNTTVGDLSMQGEIAYRPKDPLQVAVVDVVFAGFAPTLGKCHLRASGCFGSTSGIGTLPDGSTGVYPRSDFVDADGSKGDFNDGYDLAVGHAAGSGRSFPSFLEAYRAGTVGEGAPNSYIRGYEYFQTFQFNLGGTYILGAADNVLGADQVIMLFETGATYVPGLPDYDQLQLEAPGLYLHASAGADGSGFVLTDPSQPGPSVSNPYIAVGGQRQACSLNEGCSYGEDGLRFNPHQQDPALFPDKISAGYDIIALIRYESIFPGISVENQIIFKHDVFGTAPGLATNFIESRKMADLKIETRYKSALAFNVGYTWFWGGGTANLNRDRDVARAYVKYQF